MPGASGEFLGDRVSLDQARQQALAEQLHDRFAVPGREGMKRGIVREGVILAAPLLSGFME